jgi:hypothetical protein
MIRTQVQIPDHLYDSARQLAGRMEISMTELVRRGLEYMVSVSVPTDGSDVAWKLPEASSLGGVDPFAAPDWREQLHMGQAKVAEAGAGYKVKRTPK